MKNNKEIIENFVEEDTLKNRYLSFNIGHEVYAFPIKYVTEIIGLQFVTEVPNIKDYIIGIINLRGIIVPVVEIRKRFKLPTIDYSDRSCIIVINFNNNNIGLLVDSVSEVVVINSENISSPPKTNKKTQSRFIENIGKIDNEVKILLNMQKLLYDDFSLVDQSIIEN